LYFIFLQESIKRNEAVSRFINQTGQFFNASLVPVWEENGIFVYPNKSIVPDYLVHDFFNFGGRAIYFLPIGDYILVELWQVLIYG